MKTIRHQADVMWNPVCGRLRRVADDVFQKNGGPMIQTFVRED